MEQIASFIAMGGYGAYVWPAYGLTAAIMITFLITTLRNLRSRQRSLENLEANAGSRRRRKVDAENKESLS